MSMVLLAALAALAATDAPPLAWDGLDAAPGPEAAVAASPRYAWRETRTGARLTAVQAARAVAVGGEAFDAEVRAGPRGDRFLTLRRVAAPSDRDGCTALARDLAAEAERRFGPFAPPSIRRGESRPQVLKAGTGSTLALQRLEYQRQFEVRAERRLSETDHAEVYARFGPLLVDGVERDACRLEVRLARRTPRPETESIAFERLTPVRTASLGLLHHSLDGLAAPPAEPVTVRFACRVDRRAGRLFGCTPEAGTLAPLVRAAERRLDAFAFDTDAFDPDDDVPLTTTAAVVLRPEERLTLTPPADLLGARDVTWLQAPRPAETARLLGDRAIAPAQTTRAVVPCLILQDGSLACTGGRADGDPAYADRLVAFVREEHATTHRAASALPDGSPSAGRWVALSLAAAAAR